MRQKYLSMQGQVLIVKKFKRRIRNQLVDHKHPSVAWKQQKCTSVLKLIYADVTPFKRRCNEINNRKEQYVSTHSAADSEKPWFVNRIQRL